MCTVPVLVGAPVGEGIETTGTEQPRASE